MCRFVRNVCNMLHVANQRCSAAGWESGDNAIRSIKEALIGVCPVAYCPILRYGIVLVPGFVLRISLSSDLLLVVPDRPKRKKLVKRSWSIMFG